MTKPLGIPEETTLERESSVDHRKLPQSESYRRKRIIAESIDISPNYTPPVYPKDPSAVDFLHQSLADNFLFEVLTDSERYAAIDAMQKEVFEAETIIIQQGSLGDYFYIIEEGVVTFLRDGVEVGTCTTGSHFGDLALLYNVPRGATCIAATDVTVWKLDRKTFQFVTASRVEKEGSDILNVLKKVPFLKELDAMSLGLVRDALVQLNFSEGTKIVEKGEIGKTFYIVMKGSIKIHDIGHGNSTYADHVLSSGDFFGERALLTGQPRAANVTAATDCTLLVLSKEVFNSVLGDLSALLRQAARRKILLSTPIFAKSHLEEFEISNLMNSFEKVKIRKNTFLTKIGGSTRHVGYYIIESGKVLITTDYGTITELSKGDHFGGHGLKDSEEQKSKLSIEILEDTTCYVIFKKKIEQAIGSLDRLGESQCFQKTLNSIKRSDLTEMRYLGKGGFGKVNLVQHNETKQCYAMKSISKVQLFSFKMTNHVMRERNIMVSLKHPLIANLVATFQDKHNLYMVIDLYHGGELYSILYNKKKAQPGLPLPWVQFYGACVYESLAYLHSHYIAYRDLKPENILIDKDGYCVMIDFGMAKVVNGKTYSKCGTAEYIAPEILLSRGYDMRADLWSYGIFLFELLAGHTTFYQKGMSEMVLFRKIIRGLFTFPLTFEDNSKDLISKLLKRDPVERLGYQKKYGKEVKCHEFFEGVDWEELLKKEIAAPMKPPERDDLTLGRPLESAPESEEPRRVLPSNQQAKFEMFGDYVD